MEAERYLILKRLALEYKKSESRAIFTKILEKVDRLLLTIVYKSRRNYPYLRSIEMQSLYHDAVIGLRKALLRVKEEEPGSKLVYKIDGYVICEIKRNNKRVREISYPPAFFENKLVDNTSVYGNLESEFIRARFKKLIEDGVITVEDFEILKMRFVDDMSYKSIQMAVGTSESTVLRRVEVLLNKLRHEFRKRNWEDTTL